MSTKDNTVDHLLAHAEYVAHIQQLGAVWPSEAQREAINDFAAQVEAMGMQIQFSAPGTSKKFAVWTVYLKANEMQMEHGEGDTVREATIAACVRLLDYVQRVWDGDYLCRAAEEPMLEKVLEIARALPKE
jgi:hypothetical protein